MRKRGRDRQKEHTRTTPIIWLEQLERELPSNEFKKAEGGASFGGEGISDSALGMMSLICLLDVS